MFQPSSYDIVCSNLPHLEHYAWQTRQMTAWQEGQHLGPPAPASGTTEQTGPIFAFCKGRGPLCGLGGMTGAVKQR